MIALFNSTKLRKPPTARERGRRYAARRSFAGRFGRRFRVHRQSSSRTSDVGYEGSCNGASDRWSEAGATTLPRTSATKYTPRGAPSCPLSAARRARSAASALVLRRTKHNQLGIAMAKRTYKAYREMLDSDRWRRLANEGARPQRLLWASTGTKDASASDVLYARALAAPFTVNTMPEKTLLAFGDHGHVDEFLPTDGGNAEQVIARFAAAGVDVAALAARLQDEAADAFVASWDELIENIGQKTIALTAA